MVIAARLAQADPSQDLRIALGQVIRGWCFILVLIKQIDKLFNCVPIVSDAKQ